MKQEDKFPKTRSGDACEFLRDQHEERECIMLLGERAGRASLGVQRDWEHGGDAGTWGGCGGGECCCYRQKSCICSKFL